MSTDPHRFEGLGVPADYRLKPGMAVMVAAGTIAAQVNGHPPIIAYAVVRELAADADASVFTDPAGVWWLDVYMGGPEPLPQMYRRDQILGIPALGLAPTSVVAEATP